MSSWISILESNWKIKKSETESKPKFLFSKDLNQNQNQNRYFGLDTVPGLNIHLNQLHTPIQLKFYNVMYVLQL